MLGRGRKVAYSAQLYIRSGPAHAPPAVHERRRSFIFESRSLSNEDMHVDEEVGVLREEPLVDEAGTEFGLGMVGLGAAARADEAGVDMVSVVGQEECFISVSVILKCLKKSD